MMQRKAFLKSCLGMCSCAGFGLLAPENSGARTAAGSPDNPEAAELEKRLDAARTRFAEFVDILNRELESGTRDGVLRKLGVACAEHYKEMFANYKNDLPGFLNYARSEWAEEASFDETSGTIRVVDSSPKCVCPLVKPGTTPGAFCACTIGWQTAAYSAITGKAVEVDLVDSILRGARRCSFRIRIV